MSLEEILLVGEGSVSSCAQSSTKRLAQCEHGPGNHFAQLCRPIPSALDGKVANIQPTAHSSLFPFFSSAQLSSSTARRLSRKTDRSFFYSLGCGRPEASGAIKPAGGDGPATSTCCSRRPVVFGHAETHLRDDVFWSRRDASLSPVMPNAEDDGDDDYDEGLKHFLAAAAKRFVTERVWEQHLRSCERSAQFGCGVDIFRFCRPNAVVDNCGGRSCSDNKICPGKNTLNGDEEAAAAFERVADEQERDLAAEVVVEKPAMQLTTLSSFSSPAFGGGNTALKFTSNDFGIVRLMALSLMEEEERNRRFRRPHKG